jgi:hypothetical protein
VSPPDATAVDGNAALDGQLQRLVGRRAPHLLAKT